MQASSHLRACT